MSPTPEVSVVMSVYNGGTSLTGTTESVLTQQDVDFELVVVDDGSTDDSGRSLDEYARRDGRVRVIHQENQGLTRALMTGCAAARGRYIARQDAGDISHPGRLALQKEMLDRSNDLVFVSCWTLFVGPEDEPLFVEKGTGQAVDPLWVLSDTQFLDGPSSHPSVMFRADTYQRVGGYRPQFRYGEDWDLWYRLAALGKFQMVPRVLYTARVTPDSMSSLNRARLEALGALSREAARLRAGGGDDAAVLQRAAAIPPERSDRATRKLAPGLYFIGECLRRNGDPRARKYLRRAVAADPLMLRAWIRMLQQTIAPRPRRIPGES